MRIVAITGGIGSGKSTIAKMIQVIGYPVFYADQQASTIIDTNEGVKAKFTELFGKEIYLESGKLNRPLLASIIFNNENAKQQVNSIVHPAVWEKFVSWSKTQTSRLVFMESAIIHECGWADRFDKIICITADLETRIQRTMLRDNTTRAKVAARINNQMSDAEKIEQSDFTIYTNEECFEIEQLLNTLEKIL